MTPAYDTYAILHRDGIVHLYDDESAGFPLCGAKTLEARGWDDVAPRAECTWCRGVLSALARGLLPL